MNQINDKNNIKERTLILSSTNKESNILYIMERDMRIHHNYAINLGYDLSYKFKSEFHILNLFYSKMNKKQKVFQLECLEEIKSSCNEYNLYFHRLIEISELINSKDISHIIIDFSPLREYKEMLNNIINQFSSTCSIILIDTHNIIPCFLLSTYKRTPMSIRKILYSYYDTFLIKFTPLEKHKYNKTADATTTATTSSSNNKGGFKNGMKQLEYFLNNKLIGYKINKNNPSINNLSCLSPWIHTGQISAQEVVIRTIEYGEEKGIKNSEDIYTFINEIFIWREIADHFCYHEPNYDNINGSLKWAKESLLLHEKDKRPYIYSIKEMKDSLTNDEIWNAGQREMIKTGKMHGYIRMYWAKQIPKWTKNINKAIKVAIYLNDKYSLDGNDPNGYLGIMWSICGSMDRGFKERKITGKIRTMIKVNNIKEYLKKWKK